MSRRRGVALILAVALIAGCQTSKEEPKEKAFTFYDSPSRAVSYSPDGNLLLVLRNRTVNDALVLDAKTLAVGHTFRGVLKNLPHQSSVPGSVVFSPDGHRVAIVGLDERLTVWNLKSWEEQKSFRNTQGVKGVAFLKGGDSLVAVGPGRLVRIFKVRSGEQTGAIVTHQGDVLSVASIPGGDFIAIGGMDGTIQLWDLAHGVERARIKQKRPAISVSFSPDGSTLASSEEGLEAKLWHIESVRPNENGKTLKQRPWMTTITQVGKWSAVVTIEATIFAAFLVLGFMAGGGHGGGDIPVGYVAESAAQLTLEYNCPVAFSPDGRYLGMVQYTQNIRGNYHSEVYDARTFRHLSGHMGGVSTLSFSPDGKILAVGGRKDAVLFLDPVTGKKLSAFTLKKSELSP